MTEQQRNILVASSNANLPRHQAVAWGAAQHLQFMEATGYDGFEVMPLRSRLAAEVVAGVGSRALEQVIVSTHQPFRRRTVPEILTVPRSLDEAKKMAGSLAIAGGMPRVDKSLSHMLYLQERAGRAVNAVVYPNEQVLTGDGRLTHPVDYREWQGKFANVIWQPTAEVLANWGVLSRNARIAVEGIRYRMEDEGLDGVCFDTYHWVSTRDGFKMPAWGEALPRLLRSGDCVELHAAPARPDMGGSTEQLELILGGDIEATELGDMLACVRENRDPRTPFLVVVEMPHEAVLAADISSRTFTEVHEDVVDAIWSVVA